MKIRVGSGSKKINVEVRKLSYLEYWLGLMLKSKNTDSLLFDMPGNWGIHSWFVFFPFLALWLDEGNNVLEWKIVKPFSFFVKPKIKFARLVEIPVNDHNKHIISVLSSGRGKV